MCEINIDDVSDFIQYNSDVTELEGIREDINNKIGIEVIVDEPKTDLQLAFEDATTSLFDKLKMESILKCWDDINLDTIRNLELVVDELRHEVSYADDKFDSLNDELASSEDEINNLTVENTRLTTELDDLYSKL